MWKIMPLFKQPSALSFYGSKMSLYCLKIYVVFFLTNSMSEYHNTTDMEMGKSISGVESWVELVSFSRRGESCAAVLFLQPFRSAITSADFLV